MTHTCRTCKRVNPAEAEFCYYDGTALAGQGRGSLAQAFRHPFVFPSGVVCRSFEELALACQREWQAARELLQQGHLERFFAALGRPDLAQAALQAAHYPDLERGLDQLLARLPAKTLAPPKLHVEPLEVNLGELAIGQDRQLELHLHNEGMRLLYGTASCEDCLWLGIGEAPGSPRKLFQLERSLVLPVHVHGKNLRAGNKPLEAPLVLESNGGTATVIVRARVPVKPFPEGALAGATSPRQIAEKARAAPREAAALFESGAVTRWYKENGWGYPVQGPAASGVSAVQQFFEALGLTVPPRVEISQRAVQLRGPVGGRVEHTLRVWTQEKRPVYAHAVSDQPWLQVGRVRMEGRSATIPLIVPAVPPQPGGRLQARVAVTANGNQRFAVTVALQVGSEPEVRAAAPPPAAVPVAQVATAAPMAVLLSEPPPTAPGAVPVYAVPIEEPGGWPAWAHLVPVGVLALALLAVVLRDVLL